MQVGFRYLLAASLTAVSLSCIVDTHGLGGKAGGSGGGAGVTDSAGSPGFPNGGAGGQPSTGGATGTAGVTGVAGTSGTAGTTGTAGSTGAAGISGAAGTTGVAGMTGAAGNTGAAGITGAAGASGGGGGSTVVSLVGCSDGTREGYLDLAKYPTVAACSGGWDEAGLTSAASRTPQCNRRAGNDGERPTGGGCSAADLCAVGWRVCENAEALATVPDGCADAIAPFGDNRVFFVTRQRVAGLTCSATAQGSNNVYGCGNFGGTSDHSCNPLTRLLRDTDCDNNAPWSCSNGTLGNDVLELDQIVKGGPLHGGVLCCKD
jgi:hypothetical protein